jgi:N-acetylmuramoyl-L-alanine amidase
MVAMLEGVFAGLLLWGGEFRQQFDRTCLALNIYHEARGESLPGQHLVAFVTVSRSEDNNPEFGGKGICNVVFHRNVREDGKVIAEFSWTAMATLSKKPLRRKAWQDSLAVAQEWTEGAGKVPSDLGYARYYLNPNTAGRGGLCWFRRHTVPIKMIGNHRFYRRPRSIMEWMGTRSVPKECYKSLSSAISNTIPVRAG